MFDRVRQMTRRAVRWLSSGMDVEGRRGNDGRKAGRRTRGKMSDVQSLEQRQLLTVLTLDLDQLDAADGIKANEVRPVGIADFDGDGFQDLVLEDTGYYYDGGNAGVIFGGPVDGTRERMRSFGEVEILGDVDGDGRDDLLLASFNSILPGSSNPPALIPTGSYSAFVFPEGSVFDVQDFEADPDPYYTTTVSQAGDINGDGIDDLFFLPPDSTTGYLIFGRSDGFESVRETAFDSSDGVQFTGSTYIDDFAVADVNGDGMPDVLVSSRQADLNGHRSGSGYVVFNQPDGLPASVDLLELDGTDGFRIDGSGTSNSDQLTGPVPAGDVNGDGIEDIRVSTRNRGNFVIYGSADSFPAVVPTDPLSEDIGRSIEVNFSSETTVSGDFNADGITDVAFAERGRVFVVAGPIPDDVPVNELPRSLVIVDSPPVPPRVLDVLPRDGSVDITYYNNPVPVMIGDINGDGFDDLVLTRTGRVADIQDYSGDVGDSGRFWYVRDYEFFADSFVVFGRNFDDLPEPNVSVTEVDSQLEISVESHVPLDVRVTLDTDAREFVITARTLDFDDTVEWRHSLDGPSGELTGVVVHGDQSRDVRNRIDLSAVPLPATIHGSTANDTIIGGSGADELFGGDGDDQLVGKSGNDVLHGGNGNDHLTGNAGADRLFGEAGNDRLRGGAGFDRLMGGSGNDRLKGQGGADELRGGDGIDTLDGGAGPVRLIEQLGSSGTTAFLTDSGLTSDKGDVIRIADGVAVRKLVLFGTNGRDTIDASAFTLSDLVLRGRGGNDELIGGSGDDLIYGDDSNNHRVSGNDTLNGGAGNDVLNGFLGSDSLIGGAGDDVLNGDETATVQFRGNFARRRTGNDTLHGGEGNDILNGHLKDDLLYGGAGDDILNGDDNESLRISRRDERFFGGRDTLHGGAGNDVLKGELNSDLVFGDAGEDTISGGDGDTISGGAGNDQMTGGGRTGPVLRETVAGSTIIRTNDGRTVVETGPGEDSITGRIHGAQLIGDAGHNRIDASGFNGRVTLLGGDGRDTLIGTENDDVIDGGIGNDVLRGGPGNDSIDGRGGRDRIDGGDGNDVLLGGGQNDTLSGASGDDTILGERGIDLITGGEGADRVASGGNNVPIEERDRLPGEPGEIDESLRFDFAALLPSITAASTTS